MYENYFYKALYQFWLKLKQYKNIMTVYTCGFIMLPRFHMHVYEMPDHRVRSLLVCKPT